MDPVWLTLIIPVCYYSVSTFFLCFPNLLHKRKKYAHSMFNQLIESDKLLCIGHRGGAFEGPQNTLQVFQNRSEVQHMFQLDVCLTRDGQLVVNHDASLLRVCGVDRLVTETNYEDLPPFKDEVHPFGGDVFGISVKTNLNKMPLLDEVFSKFPDKPMNIELKTPTDEAIKEYARLVKKHGREHLTIWGVAGGKNDDLRASSPETVNFYSAGEILKIYLLFLAGLLPFVCIRQGVVDIPLATDSFYKIIKKFSGDSCMRSCLGFFIFQILNCFNGLGRLWIRHLKKRGILTFYFILNAEEDFDTAIASGCSGIMTDEPTKLNKYLKKRDLYFVEESDSF